jgi:hypothetical protein
MQTQKVFEGCVFVEAFDGLHLLTELWRNHIVWQENVYEDFRQGVAYILQQIVFVEVTEGIFFGIRGGRTRKFPLTTTLGPANHFDNVCANDVDICYVLFQ